MAYSDHRRSCDPICTRWDAPWHGSPVVADTGRVAAQVPVTRGQSTVTQSQWAAWWQVEPSVGRMAHGVPHRMDRLRGLGNAIVPQVAYQIIRTMIESEEQFIGEQHENQP